MNHRPRRLRTTIAMRNLVADVSLSPRDLMLPIFVREGIDSPREISGMSNVLQHTEESFLHELDRAISAGIMSVMFFAIPAERDGVGSEACQPNGILSRVVRKARAHAGNQLVLVADLCLDEFTDHGHCGVLNERGEVDNDMTLSHYASMAQTLAEAGADLVGTSGMMDGQVGRIRSALDEAGHVNTGILAYSAKYASHFYGPFRNAVESQLDGDRKTYQQDFRRSKEAKEEILLDISEGADIIMVKPALAYMDVIALAADLSDRPVATYIVSGEYAMVEAAASAGVLDRDATIFELLYGMKRAGANIICTYWAIEFAMKIKEQS